jgi:RNA polymerase sigma-70 factor, ECF subfamily
MDALGNGDSHNRATSRARDTALAARLRRGDESAYRELHRLHCGAVIGFARRRLGDWAEAEDVAQDVFLEVVRSIGSYQGRSSLRSWILGIAHHEVCNRFRRWSPHVIGGVELASTVAALAPTADRAIDAARALQRCAETLAHSISPLQSRIFALRYGETRSTEAIAREIGRSEGAVRIGLWRARRALETLAADVGELLAAP